MKLIQIKKVIVIINEFITETLMYQNNKKSLDK